MDSLKRFCVESTSPKTKHRIQLMSDIISYISQNSDVPNGVLNACVRALGQTLGLYRDVKSRRICLVLIESLLQNYPAIAFPAFIRVLDPIAKFQTTNQAYNRSESAKALVALNWTCAIAQAFLKQEKKVPAEWSKLVELQSSLYFGTQAGQFKTIAESGTKTMTNFWKNFPGIFDKYAEVLISSDPTISNCVVLISMCTFDKSSFQKRKQDVANVYIKSIIMSKSNVPSFAVACCRFLIEDFDHANFENVICPAMQKSLLRSPENALSVFTSIVSYVGIDLSRHAVVLVKMLVQQLISKVDSNRNEAANAVVAIAAQCSDAGAIEDVIKILFGLLKGSEGKLTIAGQKMCVLSGIAGFGKSPFGTGSSATSLVQSAINQFLPFLQQEIHDGTLAAAGYALSNWCANLRNDIPKDLLNWFVKAPSLKVSTPAVRIAYLDCMISMYKSDNLEQMESVIPYLLQTVEKANQQQSMTLFVTEALYASVLLCKADGVEFKKSYKLSSFWNLILDPKNSLFTSDKFLQNISDKAMTIYCSFITQLFLDHPTKLARDVSKPYYRALIYCLLTKPWQAVEVVKKFIKKLLAASSGLQACLSLLVELSEAFDSNVGGINIADDDVEERRNSYKCCKALSYVVDMPNMASDKEGLGEVARKIFVDSHQPCISCAKQNFFTSFLANHSTNPLDFVKENLSFIDEVVIFPEQSNLAKLAALKTSVKSAPDFVLPLLAERVQRTFDFEEIRDVTKKEVEILNTPKGELWNIEIIDSFPKIVESKNIKRESKAYSYKEQMMGMELTKELEEKKKLKDTGGAEGPGGKRASRMPTNLTKKQKETIDQELEKEAAIRNKMKAVDLKFQTANDMFVVAMDSGVDRELLLLNFSPLVNSLIALLKSALASTRAQNLFVLFTSTILPPEMNLLGKQVAYTTLRMYEPACKVDSRWCFQKLNPQILNLLERLSYMFQTDPQQASVFFFFFPFLQKILDRCGAIVSGNSEEMCKAIRLLLAHVQVSKESPLVPRATIITSMSQLIGTSEVDVLQLASTVLATVCEAASLKMHTFVVNEVKSLLNGLLSPRSELRIEVLKGCLTLHNKIRTLGDAVTDDLHIIRRIWVAMHDDDENVKEMAIDLWGKLRYMTSSSICTELLEDVQYHEPAIQQAAAFALHEALIVHSEVASLTLQCLIDLYYELKERPPPILDELGRVVGEAPPDKFQARIGVALALKEISPELSEEDVEPLISLYIPDALCDPHQEVRNKMLIAAVQAVNDHGKATTSVLQKAFEDFLKQAPNSREYDEVRQSVVILLGTLAKHLDKDDPKIKPIVAKLTETLSTPSQAVQEAVAECLPSLVPSIKADAPKIVQKLLIILLQSEKYGERKGAAYGLAGIVKGLGIISFKQLDIMTTLTEAIQDKKNFKRKEGALLAFEMFCKMLGRLFEPYVVHVLPHLLLCFGDSNSYVREAAVNTARAVMHNLSAHGVRLVLPSLLNGLKSDDSWRTKCGSTELLGAMAYCAPKQLSACLPSIVPRLCEVITDSHPKVQKAGVQALRHIRSVIRNPEIQAISGVLLNALADPGAKTAKCLSTLLRTKFVHFIDAPSLALILPVVERSFNDRSTDTRKMAAQIIGNMYSLTDEKDLKPYLPSIIPGLKATLLDPVPEVRSIAAKALGSMVKVTGESQFEELLPWVIEHLTSEQSSVDRSGAAQGLSEMLSSLGTEKLDQLMPEIVKTAGSDDIMPHVRDGYIMLYVYLPLTFGNDFISYISDVVKPLLKGLADENEYVRATALLAGRRIISSFSENAIHILLPELEKGLFDDNWRIRLSSVQLIGDLLYHISGVTGKMSATGEEDENYGTSEGFKAVAERLGMERRDKVLAGLYMGRCDVALNVRQSALHVWKIIVPNTPRVLREILPTLFKLLLGCLASTSFDKRQLPWPKDRQQRDLCGLRVKLPLAHLRLPHAVHIAARALGDIVRKLGERMLPELIPILERGLHSDDSAQRQGVCIGLSEIIKSCSKDAILSYSNSLVPTVRAALCDPLPEVRATASATFDHLHSTLGVQVLDKILPDLLDRLKNEDTSDAAVDALKQIISVKSHVVLPFIVPKLLEPPVNTQVLALFAAVAGDALTRHLVSILKTLTTTLISLDGTEQYEPTLKDAEKVILSVEGEHGMRIVVDDLLVGIKNQDPQTRYVSLVLLQLFCKDTSSDYSDYVTVFIQSFIKLLADSHERVQSQAWDTLAVVTASFDAAAQQKHISSVRQALRYIRNDEIVLKTGTLPGFCLPKKGLSPLLPMFREGILNGSPDLKEQVARTIGECIQYLTPVALKPSVVNITGPLIRILGDRFSWNVKLAVLETLSKLLVKVGVILKPFLPQLQTTFTKALQDANRSVRLQAGVALSNLCLIHTRIDPLFVELNNAVRNSEDMAFKETLLQALRGCIRNGGGKLNDKVKDELVTTLTNELSMNEEKCRNSAAACLGTLCTYLQENQVAQLLEQHVFAKEAGATWSTKQGRSAFLAISLKESCSSMLTEDYKAKIFQQVLAYVNTDRVQIVSDGIHSSAYLLHYFTLSNEDIPTPIAEAVKAGLTHSSNDMKVEMARSLSWCMQQLSAKPMQNQQENGQREPSVPLKTTCFILPFLLSRTTEKNTSVRSSAEHAIVSLLQLRKGENILQQCVKSLGARDSNILQELAKQKFKKIVSSTEILEEIDNTFIKS